MWNSWDVLIVNMEPKKKDFEWKSVVLKYLTVFSLWDPLKILAVVGKRQTEESFAVVCLTSLISPSV